MPTPQTGTPPLPPSVTAQQQGPALAQYAQGAAAGANPQQQAPSKQFVQQALAQIAESMAKIAKVLSVEQPELMPILQRMAGAGKMLEQEFSKSSQGQGSPTQQGSEPGPGSAPEGQEALGL